MPISNGTLSGRFFRVVEPLPPQFDQTLERNLKRYAFQPVNPEKGQLRSMGWVNVRQMLDTRLTPEKVMFDGTIAVGLRIDKITINARLFRATLAEEIAKALREQKVKNISREQRAALEDQVRQKLIAQQVPGTTLHEMAWNLERGLICFTGGGDKLNTEFQDLFMETFQVSVEPQFPFYRAQRYAVRQHVERELLELLPSPFSADAPAQVVEVGMEKAE